MNKYAESIKLCKIVLSGDKKLELYGKVWYNKHGISSKA